MARLRRTPEPRGIFCTAIAATRGHVGHVGYPELVRSVGLELAFDQVGCRLLVLVAARCHDPGTAPAQATDVRCAHEPGHTLAADFHALIDQLGAHARHAVGRVRLGVHGADALGQHGVVDCALVGCSVAPGVVAARRDLQHPAHRCDLGVGLVRVHEFVDPMDVLPSLAANQAVTFARMSRSCWS
jgi:hypothetical protein